MPSKPRRKVQSFPKEQWQEKIIYDLKFLVAFLNFDFDDRPTVWRDLRQYDNRLCDLIIAWFREETFPAWIPSALQKIQRLKSEIINDITQLIQSVGATQKSFPDLEFFGDKLNSVLKPEWYAEPFSPKILNKRLTPYQGLLQFGAVTWSVSLGSPVKTERQYFYGIIGMALESGELPGCDFAKIAERFSLPLMPIEIFARITVRNCFLRKISTLA
jgi:hypothetical protein